MLPSGAYLVGEDHPLAQDPQHSMGLEANL